MRCRFITRRIVSSMLILHNKLHAVLFATLFSVCGSLMAADKVDSLLSKAQSYLNNGQAEQAYQLLIANELEYAGNTDYDYWLGVSSLAAGQYIMATLAYERVLIITPENLSARFDMGLAYLRMGNNERALQEFERVKQANPQRNIRVLLDEAIAQARVDKTQLTLAERLSGSLSMKVGYDSNINYATSDDSFLAYLNGFPVLLSLNPDNVSKSDRFAKLDADIAYQKPIGTDSQLEFRAYGSTLQPFNETQFGTIDINASAAYQKFSGKGRWELGLDAGVSWLDGDDYQQKAGGWLGWRETLNDNNLLDIAGLYHQIRYQQASLEINDYDQTLVVARLIHKIPGKPMIATFGAMAGFEDALYRSANGDKEFAGVNFGLQGPVSFASSAYINFGLTRSFYQDQNNLFLETREDDQLDFKAGLIWQLDKQTALTAELDTRNLSSNIPLYSYERAVIGLTLKRAFGD